MVAKNIDWPNAQAVQDAIGVLEGRALFDGDERQVFVRVGEYDGGTYLDLADAEWCAVEIRDGAWNIVDEPPVIFRRARGMEPLPEPARGGRLDELREFVNVRDSDWQLFAMYLAHLLSPRGPYPILELFGPQGSAKTTAQRLLRALVDPNQAALRNQPRNVHDLMIAAKNGWVLAFDNVSELRPWLSDALCSLATGAGFATRELWSDSEETIFSAQRPIVVNGIAEVITRGDLLDRSLVLGLEPI